MRAIARMVELPKTTVIERLSQHGVGHGHIAGGQRKGRVLTEGMQAGQNNRNLNQFNRTSTGSPQKGHCFGDPLGVLPHYHALFHTFLLDQEDELEELVMYYAQRGFPFSDEKLCQLAYELASKTNRKGFLPTKKIAGRK